MPKALAASRASSSLYFSHESPSFGSLECAGWVCPVFGRASRGTFDPWDEYRIILLHVGASHTRVLSRFETTHFYITWMKVRLDRGPPRRFKFWRVLAEVLRFGWWRWMEHVGRLNWGGIMVLTKCLAQLDMHISDSGRERAHRVRKRRLVLWLYFTDCNINSISSNNKRWRPQTRFYKPSTGSYKQ